MCIEMLTKMVRTAHFRSHEVLRGELIQKNSHAFQHGYDLVAVEGFEPSQWMSQSHLPYRLATPQYLFVSSWWLNI